jgi:putative spermidine/putrescine transport system ATP-binding protein
VRPEQIRFGAPAADQVGLDGTLVDVQFHGPVSRYEVQVDGAVLTVSLPGDEGGDGSRPRAGEPVRLAWPRAAMVPLEPAA